MTDSTEGMTPAQRAEAYEAEAARIIDRTIRKLPEGVETDASRKLVELIVQASVERIRGVQEAETVSRIQASELYQVHTKQNRCQASGVAGICHLPYGHDGDHTFR